MSLEVIEVSLFKHSMASQYPTLPHISLVSVRGGVGKGDDKWVLRIECHSKCQPEGPVICLHVVCTR